jgi:threonine dehydratase
MRWTGSPKGRKRGQGLSQLVDEVRLVSEQELLDAIRIFLLDEHVVAEDTAVSVRNGKRVRTKPRRDK